MNTRRQPPVWGQEQEEKWILQDLPIVVSQEAWVGPTLNWVLEGYLHSLKRRDRWWPDTNTERLRELAAWVMRNNPIVDHIGGISYEVVYLKPLPDQTDDQAGLPRFQVIYKD